MEGRKEGRDFDRRNSILKAVGLLNDLNDFSNDRAIYFLFKQYIHCH